MRGFSSSFRLSRHEGTFVETPPKVETWMETPRPKNYAVMGRRWPAEATALSAANCLQSVYTGFTLRSGTSGTSEPQNIATSNARHTQAAPLALLETQPGGA
jgi:hypothetical protein